MMAALPEDPRLRDIIVKVNRTKLVSSSFKHDTDKLGIAILGFPFDEGCVRNGGRAGAKQGPSAFREHLYKIGCHPNAEYNIRLADKLVIYDFGDIDSTLSYDAAHSALSQTVHQLLSHQLIPFVIGGSNDQSYSNFDAFTRHLQRSKAPCDGFGVVNIDAHFDVRPKKNGLEHSGSPFRMMLESEMYRNNNGCFTEFAVQGHQCSEQHYEFIKSHQNTKVYWLDRDLRERERQQKQSIATQFDACLQEMGINRKLFVSFDVDSIRQSDCPGVSCPSPIGLSAQEAGDICFISGQNKNVAMMDMSEFNPKAESYLTGKLLSWMFYNFVLGVSTRWQVNGTKYKKLAIVSKM